MTPNPKPSTGRIPWIDIARGVALIAMAIYHFTWDLGYFGYVGPELAVSGGWKLFARSIASSFIFLAGVSLVLGHGNGIRWRSFFKREAMLIAAAAAITVGTYYFTRETFIFFGILHSIAVLSLIGLIFLRVPWFITLIVAVAAFFAPDYLRTPVLNGQMWWWTGLSERLPPPANDYVPVFPWLSAFLAGMAFSRLAVRSGMMNRLRQLPAPSGVVGTTLSFFGRHSLVFYLVHQPIMMSVVFAVSMVMPPERADPVVNYLRSCEMNCDTTNEQAFCRRFCACTLDVLVRQDKFIALTEGRIDVGNDPSIQALADQCTMRAQSEAGE